MCDVCVAYPRMSFRIYGVSATYLWRISRINGVSATYVLRSFRYCGVCVTYQEYKEYFVAFQENLNASICMFSFFRSHGSNVSHVSGCRAGFFHGYAWCSLRLCS